MAGELGVRSKVTSVATPPTSATDVGVPLIVNVTVPVGVHVAGATADTVAVNVTGSQHTDGFGSAVTAIDADAVLTAGVNVVVAAVKQASPP
jgi:hypothetical protein